MVLKYLLFPFFHPYKTIIFAVFCFSNIIMYILNIANDIKKMSINGLRNFIFENYYRQIRFSKENSYYSIKHQKKNICNCLEQN